MCTTVTTTSRLYCYRRPPEAFKPTYTKGSRQNPQSQKKSVKGVPPPRGLHGPDFFEKLTEKTLRKRGVPPPPLTDGPFPKTEFFLAENNIFRPKNIFLACF